MAAELIVIKTIDIFLEFSCKYSTKLRTITPAAAALKPKKVSFI
jgi:hypothetical protein